MPGPLGCLLIGGEDAVHARHQGRTNAVFCDGHAASVTPLELGYRLLPGGAFVDLEVVDNPPTNQWFSGTGLDADPPAVWP